MKKMKKVIALLLAVVLVLGLAACTSGMETKTSASTSAAASSTPAAASTSTAASTSSAASSSAAASGSAAAGKNYTIAMLPKFKGENYFDGCYTGAQKAADELGVTLVYDGPNQSEATNAKQVEILEGFIAAGVDCIIVSPCDAEGIVPTLQKAMAAGIKIITFDADTDKDAREFYVNPATADDIAKGLVEASVKSLKEKGTDGQPCRVGLISGSGLDTNQNEWILAIEKYMAANYSWMTVKCDDSGYLGGDIWTPGSDETAAQNAANEAVALSGNATDGSQLNVIIGTSSMSTPALAAAWNAVAGKKPDVVLTGLATPMGLIDYIQDPDNPLKYGVLWDVNNLGYLAVESAVSLLNGTIDETDGATFASKLGDKTFRVNPDDGGLELLLGDALVFGPDDVGNYNY